MYTQIHGTIHGTSTDMPALPPRMEGSRLPWSTVTRERWCSASPLAVVNWSKWNQNYSLTSNVYVLILCSECMYMYSMHSECSKSALW